MTEPAFDLDHLRQWIGRTETTEDGIDRAHALAIAATFDRDSRPNDGDALPDLWHWSFFRPSARQSEIGHDGHPRLGGFMPPIPLPRRMWVGGRLTFHTPLKVGEPASRTTTIQDLTAKSGRNGHLIFVTLRHEIKTSGALAIVEEQDIVYREAAALTADPAPGPAVTPDDSRPAADWRQHRVPDPVLLFRYSALTFNSHRIHYDGQYARAEEGYRGLVVHGPLTATLLAEAFAAQRHRRLRTYSFRAQQPLFCGEQLSICGRETGGDGFDLWAETPDGQVAMAATATAA